MLNYSNIRDRAIIHSLMGGGEAGYSSEYQTVLAAMTNTPSAVDANNQDTWLSGLVDDGIYSEADVLYLTATHTNDDGEAQINWKNPGTHDLTLVNAPTFTAYEGFQGDGTGAAIDTNYNPTSSGVKFQQDDASALCFIRAEGGSGDFDIGAGDGTAQVIASAAFSAGIMGKINSGNDVSGDGGGQTGLIGVVRESSSLIRTYRNAVIAASESGNNSTGLLNHNIFLLSYAASGSPAGYYSNKQIAMAIFGSQWGITEQEYIRDATEAYLDEYGKGVIA